MFRWKPYPLDVFIYESDVTELRFTKKKHQKKPELVTEHSVTVIEYKVLLQTLI